MEGDSYPDVLLTYVYKIGELVTPVLLLGSMSVFSP